MTTTIQQTGKILKLNVILAYIAIIVGILGLFYGSDWTTFAIIILIGLAWKILFSFLIWWQHG